jgi:hypothetical protein
MTQGGVIDNRISRPIYNRPRVANPPHIMVERLQCVLQ